MELALQANENAGVLRLELTLWLSGPEELAWGLEHCTPHRSVQWVVPAAEFSRWQHSQSQGAISDCLALCRPSVLLWGQPGFELQGVGDNCATLTLSGELLDGWIARALLERLQQADSLLAVERDLMMLELEAGGLIPTTVPGDSDDPSESLFGIRRVDAAAHRPTPELLQPAP